MPRDSLMLPCASRCFDLQTGQSLHEWVARGSVLYLVDGQVDVKLPPVWLAESMFQPHDRLGPGSMLKIETGGWLSVTASGIAIVHLVQPAPAGLRLIAWLASALNKIRFRDAGRRRKDVADVQRF
ncbi:hypothetical protein [Paraburkholderia solisilvae]|uniref:DUF2917 domain-containing protein n=1 Tax=Paraburkholderia solisilvae TaxID=624376 RepID=A0A6J5DJ08_9BURK|nr:hypothetical protein [Paraburkholderia solisilvae]CAB3754098.1 hypothetical protein LMG29739_01890 [Paraburkholderia solisilvae]